MSLKEQLAEYRAGWYQRVPAERQATMQRVLPCSRTAMRKWRCGWTRLGQNAGIVPATGQHERDFGVGQKMQLKHRAPWGDGSSRNRPRAADQ
jgi:hypothetical protein